MNSRVDIQLAGLVLFHEALVFYLEALARHGALVH
jgi:hypothetical protein